MSHGDIGIWIIEMRKRGINEFKFRDLPKHLQIKGMTRKAKGLGILKRVEKMNGYSVWKFEDHDRIK
jgi:hypothetical protein